MLRQKTPLKSKTPLRSYSKLKTNKPLKAKTPLKSNSSLKSYAPLKAKTPLKSGNCNLKRCEIVKKPRKKVERSSIVFPVLTQCCICGKQQDIAKGIIIHKHEIFFGSSNRDKSIEDKMIAPLCDECHVNGQYAVHRYRETDLMLKKVGQEVWENDYSDTNSATSDEARKAFIERFGKSWL